MHVTVKGALGCLAATLLLGQASTTAAVDLPAWPPTETVWHSGHMPPQPPRGATAALDPADLVDAQSLISGHECLGLGEPGLRRPERHAGLLCALEDAYQDSDAAIEESVSLLRAA
jgi:hypothetical protein